MQPHDVGNTTKNKKPFVPLDMNQWAMLVKQWDRTKESQQAYCKRLNLSINTFAYAKGKLNPKKELKNNFIPVTIQPNSSPSLLNGNNFFIFENRNGIKLSVPTAATESELLHLLKLIGWHHA